MTSATVLALLDFSKEFVVEIDASSEVIGAVLMQEGHLIAFITKSLANRHRGYFAYEKELFAILFAVKKWAHYLTGRHFVVHTDHQSLKDLLEQKLSTPL